MKSILRKAFKKYYDKQGVELLYKPKNNRIDEYDLTYSFVKPSASFSPWLMDDEFQTLLEKVKNHTLITEVYRFYELWQLARQVSELSGDYIEIGVWRGGSSALITQIANKYSKDSKVYICDTFEGVALAGENDHKYKGGEHADTSEEIVDELLTNNNLKNYEILKGIFPRDSAHLVKSTTFKFCHIDVDVYQGAKEITEWVWDKLVIGGIIVYDDYGFRGMDGVTKYVESIRHLKDRILIHNLNGHAIVIKIA